jgi:hypothetical protein
VGDNQVHVFGERSCVRRLCGLRYALKYLSRLNVGFQSIPRQSSAHYAMGVERIHVFGMISHIALK